MPELPEVESIAGGLRREIIGLSILQVVVNKPAIIRGPHRRSWRQTVQSLGGRVITAVARRAKRLIILTDGKVALIVQLGMTGKILLNIPEPPLAKHTHFLIKLSKNKQLHFVDVRRFGRLWLVDDLDCDHPDPAMTAAGMTNLGPEPLCLTLGQFRKLLDTKRLIKSLLLDQTRIAGLGNIYADESLFAAGIHPATPACDVTPEAAAHLRRAIRRVIRTAISHGGTTFSDYRNAYGQMGRFSQRLCVYQRTGLPCSRCHTPLQRTVIAGRSTHFCPRCQPRETCR